MIAIFIVMIIVLGFVFYKDKQVSDPSLTLSSKKQNTENHDDVNSIKEANKDIIDKAGNTNSSLVSPVNADDNYMGALNSPVEVIYYSDFSAPFVGDVLDNIFALKELYQDDIVLAYRHYATGEYGNSYQLAIAADCAAKEDKFWEMADKISKKQNESAVSESDLYDFAKEIGLDETGFEECLADSANKDKVISVSGQAEEYGVMGVPTIFVNKLILAGSYPLDDFTDSADIKRDGLKTIIDEELNKVKNPVAE